MNEQNIHEYFETLSRNMMKPEYRESPYPGDRIDKELWTALRNTIFEDGHLCYHDEEGCHYVLREIIEVLKKYNIKPKQAKSNKDKIKKELYICDNEYSLTKEYLIAACKALFEIANQFGLDGIEVKNLELVERETGNIIKSGYKMFQWEVDA